MTVKQIGFKPCPRSGISCTPIPNTNKILFFGGVQDVQDDTNDSDDEDDDEIGNFYNDLYSVHVENERATWSKIELSGKKDPSKKPKKSNIEATEEGIEDMQLNEKDDQGVTKVVEEGAFTITSTIGGSSDDKIQDAIAKALAKNDEKEILPGPSPRFGAQMTIRQGILYLFGGMVEDSSDRQLTHKDLYSLGKQTSQQIPI